MIRTPIEKFLPAYMEAVARGLTRQEFADQMGLKPETVYQRVYEIRRAGHPEIPQLTANPRLTLQEKVEAILGGQKTEPKVEAEAPKPKAKAKAKKEKVEEAVVEAAPEVENDGAAESTDETLADIFG
jgi:hypothetical protein